jgi:ectoine hydroxylase-related dioxygenase (phytanoyl-CoA dioxygenase family)
MPTEEARVLRGQLEAFEQAHPEAAKTILRHKPHLILTWIADLVRHPAILDAVEDVLGPDLLCWSANFFIKDAQTPNYVSWHQDSTYWGLSEPEVMTAWVALSVSSIPSGCMRFIPGSHHDQVPHKDTFADNNLLTRGQEIAVEVDESKAQFMPLQPGEMSLHHVRLFHDSRPNETDDRRIGLAIRYIPTRIKQISGYVDGATLVRGVDRFKNFEAEPRPVFDMAPDALAFQQASVERSKTILYRGAEKVRH